MCSRPSRMRVGRSPFLRHSQMRVLIPTVTDWRSLWIVQLGSMDLSILLSVITPRAFRLGAFSFLGGGLPSTESSRKR